MLAAFLGHLPPQADSLDDDRQFVRVPPLFSDPAPISRGLFGRDAALFQERHRDVSGGEEEGRRYADDTATDDHHVRSLRRRTRVLDWIRFGERECGQKGHPEGPVDGYDLPVATFQNQEQVQADRCPTRGARKKPSAKLLDVDLYRQGGWTGEGVSSSDEPPGKKLD